MLRIQQHVGSQVDVCLPEVALLFSQIFVYFFHRLPFLDSGRSVGRFELSNLRLLFEQVHEHRQHRELLDHVVRH